MQFFVNLEIYDLVKSKRNLKYKYLKIDGFFLVVRRVVVYKNFWIYIPVSSVVDPEWLIPDPDPALNFPSSGSKQKFRIHADPDPTHVI